MNISEKIDQFIEHEGKGCVRDALNVALSRLGQKQLMIESKEAELNQLQEEVEKLKADLEMVGSGF